ncbi:DUF4249 domain-containing protein [Spirosoma foliorum]|uniref:DUF4249 domain-containing protein n=1 Tax=Spirosoma foliorum TaxID=2710596 RepID=A0A7G5GZR8_9BACT|nr:DUF4249 domain-containing protein [Spirosoma foliorum]QMW04360.1 DUF4249 domain-containing protein [Spirosoma foliorum]
MILYLYILIGRGRHYIVWGLLLSSLWSCIDPVDLPIRQTEHRLVVDGLITDEAPPYIIKLTYSGNLNRSLLIPDELAINGAMATIEDNLGNRAPLVQDPLNPAYYLMRDARLQGVRGRAYTLRVKLPDGSQYVSRPEVLAPVPPIEQLYATYHESDPNTLLFNTFLVQIDTKDPPTSGNFYRWQAMSYMPIWGGANDPLGYYNPALKSGEGEYAPFYGALTNVLSDQLINGNRIKGQLVLTAPLVALGTQYMEVRQYSLSKTAYQYWVLYQEQLARTGTIFDPQPASIEGNVRAVADTNKLALGYFGASAVSRQRIIMNTDNINYGKFVTRFGPVLFGSTLPIVPGLVREEAQLAPPSNWLTYGK